MLLNYYEPFFLIDVKLCITEQAFHSNGKHQDWSSFKVGFFHQEKSKMTKKRYFLFSPIIVAFIIMAVTFEVEVCCVVRDSVRQDVLWSRCVGCVKPAGTQHTLYSIGLFPCSLCCVSMEVAGAVSGAFSVLCGFLWRERECLQRASPWKRGLFFLGHFSCPDRNFSTENRVQGSAFFPCLFWYVT